MVPRQRPPRPRCREGGCRWPFRGATQSSRFELAAYAHEQRAHGSEEARAELAWARSPSAPARAATGGSGMGFPAAAALRQPASPRQVTELSLRSSSGIEARRASRDVAAWRITRFGVGGRCRRSDTRGEGDLRRHHPRCRQRTKRITRATNDWLYRSRTWHGVPCARGRVLGVGRPPDARSGDGSGKSGSGSRKSSCARAARRADDTRSGSTRAEDEHRSRPPRGAEAALDAAPLRSRLSACRPRGQAYRSHRDTALTERLRAATEVLEAIIADRGLLARRRGRAQRPHHRRGPGLPSRQRGTAANG